MDAQVSAAHVSISMMRQVPQEFPDPVPVDGSTTYRARKKRKLITMESETPSKAEAVLDQLPSSVSVCTQYDPASTSTFTQTEETVYSSRDVIAHISRCHQLEHENQQLKMEIEALKAARKSAPEFTPDTVNQSRIKNLFSYYTGFPFTTFMVLLSFLFDHGDKDSNPVQYSDKRKDIQKNSLQDQLFLVLCRLRNGFHLKDLAYRFSLSVQSTSVIFNSVLHYMYLKLGCLSFRLHRDVIIEQMPVDYKIAIIDCTEIKTQKPSAFDSQSQCYSEYKSNTTLKSLVAIDPRGSIMFMSLLYSGSISDNEICNDGGFYSLLQKLKEAGYIQDGDAIMADKGFRIVSKLSELNMHLNISPLASSNSQMTPGDVAETRRIAAHRIHVERAINIIKNFTLVSRRIPVSLFHMINEIWFVSSQH